MMTGIRHEVQSRVGSCLDDMGTLNLAVITPPRTAMNINRFSSIMNRLRALHAVLSNCCHFEIPEPKLIESLHENTFALLDSIPMPPGWM